MQRREQRRSPHFPQLARGREQPALAIDGTCGEVEPLERLVDLAAVGVHLGEPERVGGRRERGEPRQCGVCLG